MYSFLTWRIVAVIGLVLVLGTGTYVYMSREELPPSQTFSNEYELTLQDYAGNEVELSAFKKRILVAHVWASWCTYCAEELRNLVRLKELYGTDIEILAINRAEPDTDARAFLDPLNLGSAIQILRDPDDSFYTEIAGYAMPETVFIDPDGKVFFHQRGPMKLDEVEAKIRALREQE